MCTGTQAIAHCCSPLATATDPKEPRGGGHHRRRRRRQRCTCVHWPPKSLGVAAVTPATAARRRRSGRCRPRRPWCRCVDGAVVRRIRTWRRRCQWPPTDRLRLSLSHGRPSLAAASSSSSSALLCIDRLTVVVYWMRGRYYQARRTSQGVPAFGERMLRPMDSRVLPLCTMSIY